MFKYTRTLLATLVVAVLSYVGGPEKDSPQTTHPITYCSTLHFLFGVALAILIPVNVIEAALISIVFELIENSKYGQNFFKNDTAYNRCFRSAAEWIESKTGVDFWGHGRYEGDSAITAMRTRCLSLPDSWSLVPIVIGQHCGNNSMQRLCDILNHLLNCKTFL